jgi:hypothetical protein
MKPWLYLRSISASAGSVGVSRGLPAGRFGVVRLAREIKFGGVLQGKVLNPPGPSAPSSALRAPPDTPTPHYPAGGVYRLGLR